MRQIIRLAALGGLVALSACKDDLTRPSPILPETPATFAQHGSGGVPTYSQERPGTFVDMADDLLWRHIVFSDSTAVIGLRHPGTNRGFYRGKVLMDRMQWTDASRAVTQHPGVALVRADTLLPMVRVRFRSVEAFKAVRRLPVVGYVEPLRAIGDIPPHASSCNAGTARDQNEDLRTPEYDLFNVKFRAMGIDNAWRRTAGRGVNVGLIDTGTDPGQGQLTVGSGGRFDAVLSEGRWLKHRTAWTGQADVLPVDNCGHGTKMAGVVASPRDGQGNVGVAYQSNLVSVRHANRTEVVDASDAQSGVREAVGGMLHEPGGKIVIMAWQSLNWYWQVSEEIELWQSARPNDLIFFAAAGTDSYADWVKCSGGALAGATGGGIFGAVIGAAVGLVAGVVVAVVSPVIGIGIAAVWMGWGAATGAVGGLTAGTLAGAYAGCVMSAHSTVVFPASHSNVVAVTCLDYPLRNVSNNCHYGSKVEFAAYQGVLSVHGNSAEAIVMGGSSNAVAVVGGQAALVWSRYPHMNRDQVLQQMRWAAWGRDPDAGYGVVDSYKSVGGMYGARVTSDQSAEVMYNWPMSGATLTANVQGGDGPFTYQWSNGATGQTIYIEPELNPDPDDSSRIRGRISVTVTITDHSDGATIQSGFGRIFREPIEGCPTCVQEPPPPGY